MEFKFAKGIKYRSEKIVTDEDTASRYGSGMVPVFATPALVGLMENAAMMAVKDHLPEGTLTVGAGINIRHLKATPVGSKVWAEAELVRSEGRKLEFSITAWDEEGQIGSGTHNRFVVNRAEFMKKFEK